jgi:uncharacterized protein (DUF2062 family)
MGIIPIWGIQLGTAVFLAVLMRLNKALVLLSVNISIPPMIPLIIFGSYKLGAFWMGSRAGTLEFSSSITRQTVRNNLEQYLYGSVTLAVIAAIVAGTATRVILKILKKKPAMA